MFLAHILRLVGFLCTRGALMRARFETYILRGATENLFPGCSLDTSRVPSRPVIHLVVHECSALHHEEKLWLVKRDHCVFHRAFSMFLVQRGLLIYLVLYHPAFSMFCMTWTTRILYCSVLPPRIFDVFYTVDYSYTVVFYHAAFSMFSILWSTRII